MHRIAPRAAMLSRVAPAVWLVLVACGGNPATPPDAGVPQYTVDDYCPGSPHCTGQGDGVLRVGAAAELINPTLVETQWDDRNGDGKWSSDEPFTDTNGNLKFDAVWLAGKTPGRPAIGFWDDLEARAVVIENNDVAIAIVYLDLAGLFVTDIEAIRNQPELADLPIDHILVGSTHTHAGPDTLGIFGASFAESGVDPSFLALVHQRAAHAIKRAFDARQPATMEWAKTNTVDAGGVTTLNWVNDSRDPVIFDPTLTAIRFAVAGSPGATIATVVNWSAHPEDNPPSNQKLSADYVHSLRTTIEAAIGGTTVFIQGAAGGQIGPVNTHPLDAMGVPITMRGYDMATARGTNLGDLVVDQLTRATQVPDPALSYRTAKIYAQVANLTYHFAFLVRVLERPLFFFDPDLPIDTGNLPWIDSRVTYLQIGPIGVISCPGELHPELWVGGYDGTWSWGQPIVTQTVNAPNFSDAPPPPYLVDVMKQNDGVTHAFVAGYSQDFLGYIVPKYNFVVDPDNPYFAQAEGDHYEETSSIGDRVEELVFGPMMQLAQWRAP